MDRRMFTLGAAGAVMGSRVVAQTSWPTRPVRLILSQPPGNGVDAIARLLSERLSKAWGQAVVVENRPGGQNTIGAQAAARAQPDGYTFYFATLAPLITNQYLFKSLPYDAARDFAPVGFVGMSPFSILVPASSSIQDIQGLVTATKAAPGRISYGIEGPRSFGGMVARVFAARAGLQPNLVAYASGSMAMQDAMGAQVDVLVSDLASVAPYVKQGKLRLLATTAVKRVAGWESTPALSELIPGFDMVGWFAVVAPMGTPATVIDRFNKELNVALTDPDIVRHVAMIGPIVEAGLSPEKTGIFFSNERRRWASLTKEIGVLPE